MTSTTGQCNGETHSVCETRIKKEAGAARCCYCVPHEGCDFTKSPSDLVERVVLAEEGTPLARFQKVRTDAVSEMIEDANEHVHTILKTSRLYAKLDTCVTQIIKEAEDRIYGDASLQVNSQIKTAVAKAVAQERKDILAALPNEVWNRDPQNPIDKAYLDGFVDYKKQIIRVIHSRQPQEGK